MYLFTGPFVQCMWSQHSLHHHLYFVHCDLQYSHILPGSCTPGKLWRRKRPLLYVLIKINVPMLFYCNSAYSPISSCVVGTTSLSRCQPWMHHTSGCLSDQHHGLWGVCPTYSSTSVLSSWVHLQFRDRCTEVCIYMILHENHSLTELIGHFVCIHV